MVSRSRGRRYSFPYLLNFLEISIFSVLFVGSLFSDLLITGREATSCNLLLLDGVVILYFAYIICCSFCVELPP